jgi:plasmid replication initiation protein
MSKLVVKDTALINASYSLGLSEQRLILLAILEARQNSHDGNYDKRLVVSADSYMTHFNVKRSAAYEALQTACKNLFERRFSYQEKRTRGVANVTSRWVSEVAYINETATVEIVFAQSVIPLITELEGRYTSYTIEQVANLNSGYAVRLYELLIAFRSTGTITPMQLADLRNKLGVLDGEYERMHHFKARVLDLAVSQINEHTDITVKYEQHKTGRAITAISFKFKQKKAPEQLATATNKNRDNATPDLFHNMTDDQIGTFSKRLAALPELGSNAPMGASVDDFARLIADDLKDPDKQTKYRKHLAKLGFKAAKSKDK